MIFRFFVSVIGEIMEIWRRIVWEGKMVSLFLDM